MAPVVARRPFPKKLFYRIQEVSQITGVKPHVLRYWETEFPQLSPKKDANDQRRYRREDIETVLEIKHLLYDERYTIAGARRRLRQSRNSNSPGMIDLESLRLIHKEIAGVLSLLDKPPRASA